MSGLVLGSASQARRKILSDAGLKFEVMTPLIDEDQLKKDLRARHYPVSKLALELAQAKALSLSQSLADQLIIGADQILVHDGRQCDKPADLDAARQMLMKLRGDTHELICAVCVACQNNILWSYEARARLTMRDFSDRFLDHYLMVAGEGICASVGAYQIESLGAHLFSDIQGDYFTILGLPLLPLLSFLRQYPEYEVPFAQK